MSVRVKICGITNAADAEAAVQAGADALGFMFFAKSPRYVTPETAREIIRGLPPFVARVGVFVNATQDAILRIAEQCGLDTLQLHGDESPAFCAGFESRLVYKAFRVRDQASLQALRDYPVSAWLLDGYVAGQRGGTGAVFNWELARQATSWGRPIILAGGLNPENIHAAVSQVRPYAVDVSSGVEASPGRKDPAKMQAFVRSARSVEDPGSSLATQA